MFGLADDHRLTGFSRKIVAVGKNYRKHIAEMAQIGWEMHTEASKCSVRLGLGFR